MNINEYIKPELLILVPVLYLIGVAIKKSAIKDNLIPWILGGISIALSALWVFANSETGTSSDVMTAVFTAITQGVLIAGASVYVHELIVQTRKEE